MTIIFTKIKNRNIIFAFIIMFIILAVAFLPIYVSDVLIIIGFLCVVIVHIEEIMKTGNILATLADKNYFGHIIAVLVCLVVVLFLSMKIILQITYDSINIISILDLLRNFALISFYLFLNITRCVVTEKGIIIKRQLIEWSRISSYEWDEVDKKLFTITILDNVYSEGETSSYSFRGRKNKVNRILSRFISCNKA